MTPEQCFARFLFGAYDSSSIVTGGETLGQRPYCPVQCAFCMCDGDTPEIPSGLPFITEDQLEEALAFVDPDPLKPILLGDGMTNFVAEPFAHPHIYEIIDRVCSRFPEHRVMMITTGILANPRKLDDLSRHSNLILSVSVNSLQEEWRQQLFPHPRSHIVRELLESFPSLYLQFMNLDGSETLRADLEEVYRLNDIRTLPISELNVRRIEHSRYHSPEAVALSKVSIETFPDSIRFLNAQRPDVRYWMPRLDLALENQRQMDEAFRLLMKARESLGRIPGERVGFCLAESSYRIWKKWLRDDENTEAILCRNLTYGGSITVAGLMCFSDIEAALISRAGGKGSITEGLDRLFISGRMLNRADQDLKGVSRMEFSRKIALPVDAIGP